MKSQSMMTQFLTPTQNEPHGFHINNSLFAENSSRTQNEQQLYSAWLNAEADKQKMEKIIINLQSEMEIMKSKLQNMQLNHNTSELKMTELETISDEDEDLAADTKWVRVKNSRKKRKFTEINSPEQTKQINKVSSEITTKQPKQYKPPPIMINNVNNLSEMTGLLKQIIGNEPFQTKLLNNGVNKINVSSEHAYRAVTSELKKQNVSWYSYENKQNRNIKVMIKNIHHSFSPISILNDLHAQGLEALNATPKLKWKTKEPLDMFIVSFSNKVDINKIYNIKTICNATITVEPLRSNGLIPQCKTCQSFGHTKNYCGKAPKFVKCAGNHFTTDCDKPQNEKPKCSHCGKEHPANYRGCEVIKELQKTRDNKNKPIQEVKIKETIRMAKEQNKANNPQKPGKTYSQAITDGSTAAKQLMNTEDTLTQIMQMLNDQNLRLKKIEGSLKVSNNQK